MPSRDPALARQFAVDVVRRLHLAGHQALWAGGCVRDQLLGLVPKDYDVATNATPEQIREIFGKRRTLAIGAAFGVITALGPEGAGQIDIVTFRQDAPYSDGRHPDSVSFADAEQDAQRRDFTINGLFYDPLHSRVIDYVGGQEDLRQGLVRAIGDPLARIAEDKLRMLRAVRFAARFDFVIDLPTLAAVQQQAHELVIVSAERIAAELRLIFTHRSRARGVELLQEAQLLEIVLPEARLLLEDTAAWERTLRILAALVQPTFSMALAALLREIPALDHTIHNLPRLVFQRWKLATEEYEGVAKLLAEEPLILGASRLPWPRLQRMLIAPRVEELLGYCEAVARGAGISSAEREVECCRTKLAVPPNELNPPPLITGDDLKAAGIPPGPEYRELLEAVRDAQLIRQIATHQQ
ncbi:MAG TPA: CCA tRNA nucleotidyltransferase, partial [Pirellulaceae bacterium]|nr:CCA tRNA nucleotidyltransferase [Pirellulaceae bacterium]